MIVSLSLLQNRSAMSSALASSPTSRAAARDLRRLRILASVQAGLSFAQIGRAEGLSRERVRQIVAKALDEAGSETKLDHARVQIARLEPALRLAANAVSEGDLGAIDRLLRVLDRLDKYSAVEGAEAKPDEGARTRLLTKLNTMAQRMIAARRSGVVKASEPSHSGDDETVPELDPGIDAAKSADRADDPAAASSAGLDAA
jgi:hypothetical protein